MPNHLIHSNSLYLRKHADNPIDWWPWCDEALQRAKEDDKPIFLSIGYSSCHWCTVMEGEAFSDQAIAQYMNEHFIAIKVDREERPDIDSIYMQALQMMTGHGGWPLNVFLTPDERIPFYGGTYFPVDPRYNRPSFLRILQSLRNFYDTDKEKLQAVQGEIFQRLQQGASLGGAGATVATAGMASEKDATSDSAIQSSDLGLPMHGTHHLFKSGLEAGIKSLVVRESGPRFPMIPYADLALRGQRFNVAGDSIHYDPNVTAKQRGLDLALGGIFDHVAGGFHRYTVDPSWTVPHFEKMLYDNGQIVEYLANLWSSGGQEPAFERAIAKTVQWLQREMVAPGGYFYAAQDADNFVTADDGEPEEGAFYVWAYGDLEQWLTADVLSELQSHFTVTTGGNFDGKNVLQRITTGALSPTLEKTLDLLFEKRYGHAAPTSLDAVTVRVPARTNQDAKTLDWAGRIPPVTDTKMIVAWNSLMISGLARAASVFQRSDYLDLAMGATRFILEHQRLDGRLHRLNYDGIVSTNAQSEDYALFIKALLDIAQADIVQLDHSQADTPQANFWVEQAIALQAEFDEWLWSIDQGGYYNTARDASHNLIVRERSYSDNAIPSANGVAIANLIRLFLHTNNLDYLEQAEQALNAFSLVLQEFPQACPSVFTALDWYQHPTCVKVRDWNHKNLRQRYYPTTVFKQSDELPEGAIGLVCRGTTCEEPAKTWEQLLAQLTALES